MDTIERDPEREKTHAMLAYFWQQKGDIERWCGFDRAKLEKHAPHVLKAWDDYKRAERAMDLEIRALEALG